MVVAALLSSAQVARGEAAPSDERDLRSILVICCYDCHGDGAGKGDVELDRHATARARRAAARDAGELPLDNLFLGMLARLGAGRDRLGDRLRRLLSSIA